MGTKRRRKSSPKQAQCEQQPPLGRGTGAWVGPPPDDTLNPGLQGVAERGRGYRRREQERSVEDPLQDWPEDAATERDDWLLDRDTERAEP